VSKSRGTTEVVQEWLGVDPFVLITLKSYDEDTDDLLIGIKFGGGVEREDLQSLLESILDSLRERDAEKGEG
jgi:hypothetical protein